LEKKRNSVKRFQVRRIMKNKSSTVGDTDQKAECPMQLQSEKRKDFAKDQCRKSLGRFLKIIFVFNNN
ncbi:hypothetical protein T11_3468, partial [Trichinella zimbabwensis]